VLSELKEIKVCVAYEVNGRRTTQFPSHVDDLRQARPVYETLAGWQTEISQLRAMDKLPANAQAYLHRLSQLVGAPVEVVSVGADREQTMFANGVGVPRPERA
jgi:adenylosuccinate synthase